MWRLSPWVWWMEVRSTRRGTTTRLWSQRWLSVICILLTLLSNMLCSSYNVRHGWGAGDAAEELLTRQRSSSLLPFLLQLSLVSFGTAVTTRSFLLAVSSCAGALAVSSRVQNNGLKSHCWLWQSFLISFSVLPGAAKHAMKCSPSRCHRWIGKGILPSSLRSGFAVNWPVKLHSGFILFYWVKWLVLPHPAWREIISWMLQDDFFFPFPYWINILPWHTVCWPCPFPKPFKLSQLQSDLGGRKASREPKHVNMSWMPWALSTWVGWRRNAAGLGAFITCVFT